MAFSKDQIKGIFGKFKPALDETFTRTKDSIQGVFGKFRFILDETSIFAPSLPTVTTQAVTLPNTANGNLTDTGGQDADKRGFVFGKTSKADPENVAPGSSGYDSFVEDTGTFGTGAFTKLLTSLNVSTVYYIRAYAHNSAGYGYGNEQSFTTREAMEKGVTVLSSEGGRTVLQSKNKDIHILRTKNEDKNIL